VPNEKIDELCDLIPTEADTLIEAKLISTEFSCLSCEDYVYSLAAVCADNLIGTFNEEKAVRFGYAIIPKDLPAPYVRDTDGNSRSQFDFGIICNIGVISLEFHG